MACWPTCRSPGCWCLWGRVASRGGNGLGTGTSRSPTPLGPDYLMSGDAANVNQCETTDFIGARYGISPSAPEREPIPQTASSCRTGLRRGMTASVGHTLFRLAAKLAAQAVEILPNDGMPVK